ncbi:radical SAM protein [Vulgatibacter incomptus]|uniref:Oxygen-independent coproporphyrinogen III oxidase, Fe-S oxidoreductase n=1 Tax=Vulgatibacter incomptus TaxID=1391653 RepID=A0A0K1PI66_9BACT|nr:radical SAM protein [Vulgatibacter incomptus]AKU93210.1 Oxygen-independent coproporphyrinogen III oxidase, Fe-S oxidoreductase [Vulgatibacter incomptus]
MRYEGKIYRPPSEADAYILQATIGCSWNHCTYCDMYREKKYRVRDLDETLLDVRAAGAALGREVEKVFVADGDALGMDLDHWEAILAACRDAFPRLRRVSAYATAMNLNEKSVEELERLRHLGLTQLYIGPESGDDVTSKRIAKGATFAEHAEAGRRARAAGIPLSAIFLLGVGGLERSREHAEQSAALITEMDPAFVSMLTLTVVPGTPLAKLEASDRFELPTVAQMLGELRVMVSQARPTDALFRTNHASNYLPLAGRLPADRERIVATIDRALSGELKLRPEWARGL